MIKGLNVSKLGMLTNNKKLDVSANNLANINTIGYKKDKVFFPFLIDAAQAAQKNGNSGEPNQAEIRIDYSTGSLKETGNPLDLALTGDGFFVVKTPQGNIYTRNGNFSLDSQGRLTTQDGYSVLGTNGEIQFTGNNVAVDEGGNVRVNGEVVDRLRIVTFDDYSEIVKIGGNYFSDEDQNLAIELPEEEIQIRTGYLEGSNVSGIEEMVQMIELYRQFELGQKSIATQDQTLEKLVNDAGRVS